MRVVAFTLSRSFAIRVMCVLALCCLRNAAKRHCCLLKFSVNSLTLAATHARATSRRYDGVALALAECRKYMTTAMDELRDLPESPALGVLRRLTASFPNIDTENGLA